MRISNMHDGRRQITLMETSNHQSFISIQERLKKDLGITFTHRVDDFDDLYLSFDFEGVPMTLAYGNFTGIAIYPKMNYSEMDRADAALLHLANELASKPPQAF